VAEAVADRVERGRLDELRSDRGELAEERPVRQRRGDDVLRLGEQPGLLVAVREVELGADEPELAVLDLLRRRGPAARVEPPSIAPSWS
jgi:hypothetical protein